MGNTLVEVIDKLSGTKSGLKLSFQNLTLENRHTQGQHDWTQLFLKQSWLKNLKAQPKNPCFADNSVFKQRPRFSVFGGFAVNDSAAVIAKKVFTLTMLFNSVLTVAYTVNLAFNFDSFFPDWPYSVLQLKNVIILFVLINGVLNIYPSILLGKPLHTGRLFFHHYVYGFFVMLIGFGFVLLAAPRESFNLFFVYDTDVAVNAGRLFILVGATMFIDDIRDVHPTISLTINRIEEKTQPYSLFFSSFHLVTGVLTLYLVSLLWYAMSQNPGYLVMPNLILTVNLFITSLISFAFVARNHVKPEEIKEASHLEP